MSIESLPQFIRDNYEIHEWKHASAILEADFQAEWNDIVDVLTEFRLYKSWITKPGGRKIINQYGWDIRLLFSFKIINEPVPNFQYIR